MKKKLIVLILVFIAIIVSVVAIIIITNLNFSPNTNQQNNNEEKVVDEVYININGQKLKVNLENNSTVSALIKMLPLEFSMSDLNGNEKYTYLDELLPVNTYNPGRVEAGDVMLFGDDCLVIFYESFDTNYSYTKIGHIDNLPSLGDGDVSVVFDVE